MQSQADSWGFEMLGQPNKFFFMGSLEVSEREKRSDPTSMPT
jgi:hypothetical protein